MSTPTSISRSSSTSNINANSLGIDIQTDPDKSPSLTEKISNFIFDQNRDDSMYKAESYDTSIYGPDHLSHLSQTSLRKNVPDDERKKSLRLPGLRSGATISSSSVYKPTVNKIPGTISRNRTRSRSSSNVDQTGQVPKDPRDKLLLHYTGSEFKSSQTLQNKGNNQPTSKK